MKRDTIFYQLFKRSPSLLFQLLPLLSVDPEGYRFEAIEVKETSFRMDGVFLPPRPDQDVFFCEVQQQRDNLLYERMMAEISIFAYRERNSFRDWLAVVIYPSRNAEQESLNLVREFLASGRITRIYLDELGAIEELPWGLSLMVLTMLADAQMVLEARNMLQRAETSSERSAILDLVTTAIVYRFTNLSRDEVDAMLGTELRETRVIQEAIDEGLEIGLAQGLEQGLERERRDAIESLLLARFTEIDAALMGVVPKLMAMESRDYINLLLNSSREELLALA
jgi:predicted transposase/invertase (TIGR01784 family)